MVLGIGRNLCISVEVTSLQNMGLLDVDRQIPFQYDIGKEETISMSWQVCHSLFSNTVVLLCFCFISYLMTTTDTWSLVASMMVGLLRFCIVTYLHCASTSRLPFFSADPTGLNTDDQQYSHKCDNNWVEVGRSRYSFWQIVKLLEISLLDSWGSCVCGT